MDIILTYWSPQVPLHFYGASVTCVRLFRSTLALRTTAGKDPSFWKGRESSRECLTIMPVLSLGIHQSMLGKDFFFSLLGSGNQFSKFALTVLRRKRGREREREGRTTLLRFFPSRSDGVVEIAEESRQSGRVSSQFGRHAVIAS